MLFPDPAARAQHGGPHGASVIVDPESYSWNDEGWGGVSRDTHVIYEMHVGTLTLEGTWAAARERIPYLKDLGVDILEIMPINGFPGKFGWGYDGVCLFAPTALYGQPNEAKLFIDECHQAGIAVILDVVYNHVGPDGNYLAFFSPSYFTDRYKTTGVNHSTWMDPMPVRSANFSSRMQPIGSVNFILMVFDLTPPNKFSTPLQSICWPRSL
jgi:maltooligosyltrehalose trehalohydrolase